MSDMMWRLKLIERDWCDDKYVASKLAKYRSGDVLYLRESREVLTHSISIANALARELCDTPYEITMRRMDWQAIDVAAELAAYDAESDRLAILDEMPRPDQLS